MTDTPTIFLVATWICLMFTYLLGDVLRIFSGDFEKLKKEMENMNQAMWLFAAIMMLIPIVMILLTLVLPQPLNKSVNIVTAAVLFLFNLVGLPGYPSFYDKFLIVVGLVFNVITALYAWSWIG